jgi:hypothetical protein
LYEVEVHGLMFLYVPLPFINYKDEPTNCYWSKFKANLHYGRKVQWCKRLVKYLSFSTIVVNNGAMNNMKLVWKCFII